MTEAMWASADEVRAHNSELDDEFGDLFRLVPADRLHAPVEGEWSLAENLAHIAEFPAFFARQLRRWIQGEIVVIGRVAEFDPQRNDAIVKARDLTLDDFVEKAEQSFAELAETLELLEDDHIDRMTHNVKYGEEPLRNYLHRYVVGHKAAHVRQLRETIAAVSDSDGDEGPRS